jgi:hypothetical protein
MTVPAERDHVRMFDKQELIRDLTPFPLIHQAPLEFKSFRIMGAPKIAHLAAKH